MPKQLNIRSDSAYETAQRLAKRLGTTTTEVVIRALERYDRETYRPLTYDDLTPEQKAEADEFLRRARAARNQGDPEITSNHDWLYDEYGLPK